MGFLSFGAKEEKYPALFGQQAERIQEAARALAEMLNDTADGYADRAAEIKSIEHATDELTHRIATKLNESFITPFDREDIYDLSETLDNIVDLIDSAARALVLFDIQHSTPQAKRFAGVLQSVAKEIGEVVSALEKPHNIEHRLVEIHRLEQEADHIYESSLSELFHKDADTMKVIKWKEIYEKLEAAVDEGEKLADIVERVLIKNS